MGKIIYDEELHIEAYEFAGRVKPFPKHSHEHYVFGLVERGARRLSCKNKIYTIDQGSVIIFNPGDSHACSQASSETCAYRALNITSKVMCELTQKILGTRMLPYFTPNFINNAEIAYQLRALHSLFMQNATGFNKKECLLFFLSTLLKKYAQLTTPKLSPCRAEIEQACTFMQEHFAEHQTLDAICKYTALSKSTLLRAFLQAKGITPYRYLEMLRINAAKKLLAQGVQPLTTAIQTGFSDQSHLTNSFNSFIGITPGAYREIFLRKTRNT